MDTNTPKNKSFQIGRWVWVLLSILLLATVILVLAETEDYAEITKSDDVASLPVTSVETVTPTLSRATISGYAEVKPRWLTEIRSPVSGRIDAIFDTALAGARVDKGANLVSIEKTPYQTAVSDARQRLEETRFALVQAQNKVKLAKRQTKRAGIKNPNDLVLHIPERRIAERAAEAAEAQLRAARKQLADATVKAPFSGLVIERLASLGQTVSVGEPLLRLADDRHFEMKVEVNDADWALLDHPIAGKTARLTNRQGTVLGTASIRQGGGFLDQKTRQHQIHLELKTDDSRILAGDFLQVSLPGQDLPNTLNIPETALTRAGYIWFVDNNGYLDRQIPTILFRDKDRIVIQAPDGIDHQQIAITPLASFLPGQRVEPRQLGN